MQFVTPQLTYAISLKVADGKVRIKQNLEKVQRVLEASLPALVTMEREISEPRIAPMDSIIEAYEKEIPVWGPEDLNEEAERVICVGMGGAVRLGFGCYDWLFEAGKSFLTREFTITIEFMQILPSETLDPIMNWLSRLPYPWCAVHTAIASAPTLEGLDVILDYLRGNR